MNFIINYYNQLKEKNINLFDVIFNVVFYVIVTSVVFLFSPQEPTLLHAAYVAFYCIAMAHVAYEITRTVFWMLVKIKSSLGK